MFVHNYQPHNVHRMHKVRDAKHSCGLEVQYAFGIQVVVFGSFRLTLLVVK